MQRKLPGYLLLTCLSFSFFTCIMHAVVNAQGTTIASAQTSLSHNILPTPTIYTAANLNPTQEPPLPTPTLYQPTQEEPSSDVAQVQTSTQIPVAQPTKLPEPTANVQPTAVPTLQPVTTSPGDLESLFAKYSSEYGVDGEVLRQIAKCESGFNPTSNNSGIYLGMYQFAHGTWVANRNRMGLDANPDLRMNAEEAIRTAAYVLSKGGRGAWPNC